MTMRPEPSLRDPGLDALRAAATLRVVAWHITGWAALTYVAAIPVMFAITGMLLSTGLHTTPPYHLVRSRLTRMLTPLWLFAACVLPVLVWFSTPRTELLQWRTLAWVFPILDPPGTAWEAGWASSPLWYLRAYVQILLLLPLWWLLARRHPRTWFPAWVGAVVLLELWLRHSLWAVQDLVLYGGFTVAGLSVARRRPAGTHLLTLVAVAATGAVISWWWFRPLDGVVNNSHTVHLCVGLVTAATALVALPRLTLLVSRFARPLRRFAAVSLSLYLWHSPVYALTRALVSRLTTLPAATVLAATWFPVLLVCVLVLVSFAERTALRVLPRSVAFPMVATVIAGLVLLPSRAAIELPPTPSRAPARPVFATDQDLTGLVAPSGATSLAAAPALQDELTTSSPADIPAADPAPAVSPPDPDPVLTPSPPIQRVPEIEDLAPTYGPERTAALQSIIDRFVDDNDLITVDLFALTPNVGWASVGTPTTGRDPVVPYHSVTKSFTAVLLFRAVAERRIGLDEPLPRLERFGFFDSERFTLRDVLYHRTGLPPYTDTSAFKEDWRKIDSPESTLRALAAAELLFTPGSRTEYSSSNYVVAGLLLEQLYGTPVEELLRDDLLDQLGLTATSVRPPVPGSPGTGTGNMYGTLPDLARWAYARWRDRSVLSSSILSTAHRLDPSTLIGAGMFGFCPCTGTAASPKPAAIGMNGVQVSLRYYPAADTILVWFVPTDNGLPATLESVSIDVIRALR